MNEQNKPIGVFDSGMGGLTVLQALRKSLPHEHFLYLGDTARVPYGTRSPETIRSYVAEAGRFLKEQGIKSLVVACNTVSAIALDVLEDILDPIPVTGVLQPVAEYCATITKTQAIGVLATESTIRHGAYPRAIHAINSEIKVFGESCPLFVALVEEGWIDGIVVETIVNHHLNALWTQSNGAAIDCLVLGCTHFPVLRSVFDKTVKPGVHIVDSADVTAAHVKKFLDVQQLMNTHTIHVGKVRYLATDCNKRFQNISGRILGQPLMADDIKTITFG
jgi:glutamate racemase